MVTILFVSIFIEVNAQDTGMNALKQRLATTQNDTLKMLLLDSIAFGYSETNPDSSRL